jgi:beta-glucanase (GH16 family)
MQRPNRLTAVVAILLLAPVAACTGRSDAGAPAAVATSSSSQPAAEAGPGDGGAGDGGPGDGGAGDGGPAPTPVGQDGSWKLTFSDEFDGSTLDTSRWVDRSSAEPDAGRGNPGNQQLEWNQAANCQVGAGELTMTAKRESVTSPDSGQHYDWTSCLLTTRRSDAFQYAYLEERSILPAARGFWPAFWTWQVRGGDQQVETDVYEFYSDNHTRLYSTQYSGAQGRCDWQPPFDPSAGWHTYGVAIEPSGTTWYADGKQVCHTDATAAAQSNIISNLAVYAKIPPDAATTSAVKRVDYIRAWSRS